MTHTAQCFASYLQQNKSGRNTRTFPSGRGIDHGCGVVWSRRFLGGVGVGFLSDSRSPIGSFFTSPSYIGNSYWNGTISFETFVETELSCCPPRFPLILTFKLHSLYVEESESEILERSESDIFPQDSATPESTFKDLVRRPKSIMNSQAAPNLRQKLFEALISRSTNKKRYSYQHNNPWFLHLNMERDKMRRNAWRTRRGIKWEQGEG